jgi:hypothetical protein
MLKELREGQLAFRTAESPIDRGADRSGSVVLTSIALSITRVTPDGTSLTASLIIRYLEDVRLEHWMTISLVQARWPLQILGWAMAF